MKKKVLFLALAVLMVCIFTGCCLKHDWMEADCTTPKMCAKCDEFQGEALGHDWIDATCAHPQQCDRCGKTKGEALAHSWVEATCALAKHCENCNTIEGSALGHTLSEGEIIGSSFSGYCTSCGQDVAETISDWETFANGVIMGRWECYLMSDGDNTVNAPDDTYLEFYDDGTCLTVLAGDEYDGTWGYDFHDTSDDNPCLFYDSIMDNDDFTIIIFDDDLSQLFLVYDDLVLIYNKG